MGRFTSALKAIERRVSTTGEPAVGWVYVDHEGQLEPGSEKKARELRAEGKRVIYVQWVRSDGDGHPAPGYVPFDEEIGPDPDHVSVRPGQVA